MIPFLSPKCLFFLSINSGDMSFRWEARQCPSVVVSSINPRKFDQFQTKYIDPPQEYLPAPPGMSPRMEWQEEFLEEFRYLRERIEKMRSLQTSAAERRQSFPLPSSRDSKKWRNFCFGSKRIKYEETQPELSPDHFLPIAVGEDRTEEVSEVASSVLDLSSSQNCVTSTLTDSSNCLPHSPLLSILFLLDAVSISDLLRHHIAFLIEDNYLDQSRAEWFFSLLVCLEIPLLPDMAAMLRILLRKLERMRTELITTRDTQLAPLNILITLISKYFGQQQQQPTPIFSSLSLSQEDGQIAEVKANEDII